MPATGIALPELHLRITYFGSRRFERRSERRLAPPGWVIHWNQTSTARVFQKRRAVPLGPAKLLVIPPRVVVHEILEQGEEHTYVHFTLNAHGNQLCVEPFILSIAQPLRGMLVELAQLLRRGGSAPPQAAFRVQALVCQTLAALPAEAWQETIADARLLRMIRHVQENLGRELSNAALAQIAGMSTNGFVRLFSSGMRCTPQQFVQKCRTDRAATLLLHGDEPIKQIAAQCGFCDRSHFSTIFKNQYGVGPATYRRGAKGAE